MTFLISFCYLKCQNIQVNILVYLLESLQFSTQMFQLFIIKLCSKFKVNTMVRGRIQGICVTNLFSGSYCQDSGSHVRKSQVPGCQFQGLGCQGPMSQGQNSRVTGPRFLLPTSQSQGPQSQVLVLCHILSVLQDFCQKYMILVFTS